MTTEQTNNAALHRVLRCRRRLRVLRDMIRKHDREPSEWHRRLVERAAERLAEAWAAAVDFDDEREDRKNQQGAKR
jgi:hypothetical protein